MTRAAPASETTRPGLSRTERQQHRAGRRADRCPQHLRDPVLLDRQAIAAGSEPSGEGRAAAEEAVEAGRARSATPVVARRRELGANS